MIIDCHVHLNNYHEKIEVSLRDSLGKLGDAMAEAGIDYSLVLTSYLVSPHRPSTAQVVAAIETLPHLGVVAGISYLNYRQRDLRELADFLSAGLVKGLKLYPGYEPFYPHDKRLQVVYDLAEEFDVPVMIHSGDTYSPKGKLKYAHPLEIDEVAVDHPNVKFVICHLGNPWLTDCMESSTKMPTSYAVSPDWTRRVHRAFETTCRTRSRRDPVCRRPPRFLFGTDWPICSMTSYIHFVEHLVLQRSRTMA